MTDCAIWIGGAAYVEYADFAARSPVFCKPFATGHMFSTKTPDAGCAFGRRDGGGWIRSEGKSKRMDKILVPLAFAEGVPEFSGAVGEDAKSVVVVDGAGVESAPEIIVVEEADKFRDTDGRVIEIETRGERVADKVFFSVKDVMEAFGMNFLNKTLINKDRNGFCPNIHCKYLNCKTTRDNGTIKIKKNLFLTYMGFLKVIFVSRTKFTDETKNSNVYVMKKWIDNFDATILKEYVVDTIDIDAEGPEGYVYIVSSPLLNAVKIGMWRGTVDALRARYATCYGADLALELFYTRDARALESATHAHFEHFRLSNELFIKEHTALYCAFIEENNLDPPAILDALTDEENDSNSELEEAL